MAWEQRGGHRYYYTARRVGGRVVKTYRGRGRGAAEAARCDADARAVEKADAEAAAREAKELEPLERLGNDSDEQLDLLLEATLMAAGFHQHRGQWRRRRHGSHNPDETRPRRLRE